MTIALIVNAAEVKEIPIVIWKSENPRYTKPTTCSLFPLEKGMDKLMEKLSDCHLAKTSRSILLLMDNGSTRQVW